VNQIADIASIIVTLGIVAVLVAPNSQGPKFVGAIGSAFSGAIKAANTPFMAG
jgi:hypothetical protein